MRKKILYITQSNGGVARYLQMLLKYIDKSKYEHVLIYPNEFKNEEKDFEGLFDEIEYADMQRNINIKNDFKAFVQIYKLIKKYNPDLIYVHSSKAGALGRAANIFFRKPIIYNPHGWAFNMKISSPKKKIFILIERLLSKLCSAIIVISQKERESALLNNICDDSKIKVIFNGIDIEKYDKEISRKNHHIKNLNIPENAFVIGMVGRISRQKAPDVFIKSASIIKKTIPNAFFLIVGDGEQRKEIEKLIEEYELTDCTKITGWVNSSYEYIMNFNIAMLLSRWEGFGLAIAEYMICEKPIVATNIDAIPNLIENHKNGILVNPDNEYEAANAVFEIIDNKELRDRMIENAKKRVRQEFDVKRVAKEHEEVIGSLIEEKQITCSKCNLT